jgi:hypothetical protein
MNKLKRNRIKELYRNRPTVYIPEVVKMIKKHPLKNGDNFVLYLRNMLYLNWQVCYKR